MKHIRKKQEPASFSNWKAQANDDWRPAYENLQGEIKKDLKKSLMDEQGYICCYCESRVDYDQSHIEHFKPQSLHTDESLNYDNLLCSCQKDLEQGEPRHCGNLKGDWFDKALLISPLDPNCENRFDYTPDGHIKSQDQAAEETIKKLGLNIPKLIDLRKKAIEPFLDQSLTEIELNKFVSGYLQQDNEDKFNEYFTTIKYLFESNKKYSKN